LFTGNPSKNKIGLEFGDFKLELPGSKLKLPCLSIEGFLLLLDFTFRFYF
jgi:hypothetical protein